MAKKCPEEFNPWPPFVDIFASVILVLLLFLLITIVNIGYYAQFKYKVSYSATTVTKAPIQPEDQTKANPKTECIKQEKKKKKEEPKENAFSFHKIKAPTFNDANNSLFSGGKAKGNAVQYAAQKKKADFTKQKLLQKNLTLIVSFQDKEIFVNSSIRRKIKLFVGKIQRRSKRAVYTIYVSDPKVVLSSTIAKQISLGRALNIKNIIQRSNVKRKNIKMDLQHEFSSNNPYGDIMIKVHIP